MTTLKLASFIEGIAMFIEFAMYSLQSSLWANFRGPTALMFSLFYSVGALLALSNLGYAMLGLGLMDWGSCFHQLVHIYQQVTIYLLPVAMMALLRAVVKT